MAPPAAGSRMDAFLVSLSTIAIAEMGDRTQLLSLVLAAQFRRPWAIVAGIVVATLANHALAALVGVWFGHYLTRPVLDAAVGISMIAMAGWTLIPDTLDGETKPAGRSAFLTTLTTFFIAEMGDKTQIATVALAAGYANLPAIVAGTTLGMLAANVPVVFLGNAFAARLPMKAIHIAASALFGILGLYFLWAAARHWGLV